MSEKITLKPCPFCGDTPKLLFFYDKEPDCMAAYVQCFCRVKSDIFYGTDCKKQAVEAWNRRPYEEEMTEMLDDCLEELTFCESESAEDLKDCILAFLDRIHGEGMKS